MNDVGHDQGIIYCIFYFNDAQLVSVNQSRDTVISKLGVNTNSQHIATTRHVVLFAR
jgi:hypothetical protein